MTAIYDSDHDEGPTGSSSSETFSITVPAGTTALIILSMMVGSTTGRTDAVFNGSEIADLIITQDDGGVSRCSQLWILPGPTPTTANLVMSGGGTLDNIFHHVIYVKGTKASGTGFTLVRDSDGDGGDGNSADVTLESSEHDLIVGAILRQNDTDSLSNNSGQNTTYADTHGASNSYGKASYEDASGASENHGYNWTTAYRYAMVAASLKPAPAGSFVTIIT